MVNWLGSYFELNEFGRDKRRAFTAHHSNSPQAHHPSHSCILFLALVVVEALPCSIAKEIYSLVFPRARFSRYGFSYSYIHDSYSSL
jgi:hypothetical protein